MKFNKVSFLAVLSVVALFLNVAATPMAGARSLTLIGVQNTGNSITFIFNVSGEFTRSELNGRVDVSGEDASYGLFCNQISDNRLQCTTSKKTADKDVVVRLAGFLFWTHVSQDPPPAPAPVFIGVT